MIAGLSEFLDKQESLSDLFSSVEDILGKPLDSSLVQDVIMLQEEYDFDHDRIRQFFSYLKIKGVFNHNYIVKVAKTWHENNIFTADQNKQEEEKRANEISEDMLTVLQAFGIQPHIPTDFEISCLSRWVGEYNIEVPLIAEACKISADKTKSPNFAYADAILKDWNKKGFHSLSDYETSKKVNDEAWENKKFNGDKKKGFLAYSGRKYDFDALTKEFVN